MSDRYIVIPPPAKFLDPHTRQPVKVRDNSGELADHPERTFDWFLHVYILSHLQFSVEVGGYDATKAAKTIANSLESAMDKEEAYFKVSADHHKRLLACIARPQDKVRDELMKEKPNPRILAQSSQGMTAQMTNFEASCYMDHMDAIANAITNEPGASAE